MTAPHYLLVRKKDAAVANGAMRHNGHGDGQEDLLRRIRALAAERDELLGQIEKLQERLSREDNDEDAWIPHKWFLTGRERCLLRCLAERPGVRTNDYILDAIYGGNPDGIPLSDYKMVQVFVCKMRPKLRQYGIKIMTSWGRGYYLSEESHDVIAALKEKAREKAKKFSERREAAK
jgi:hypothetical protein